jgi:hypothetical protein
MDSKLKDVSHHESVFQESVQTHEIIDYQGFPNANVYYNGYEGDDEVTLLIQLIKLIKY